MTTSRSRFKTLLLLLSLFALPATALAQDVDLALTASDNPDPVIAGYPGPGNLVHVLTAENIGALDATGVTVAVTPETPDGVTIVSVVPDIGTFDLSTLVWTIGDHPVGVIANLTITLTVAANTAEGTDVISATGVISSNENDSDPSNNTAVNPTSVIRDADMEMAASDDPDPVVAGSGAGNLVHVLSATNNGPSDASGVTVTVAPVLPAGVGVDSIVPDIGTIDPATLVWTIGDHPVGITANLTITLTVGPETAEGTDVISATGTVTANEADANEENNTAVDPTSVERSADMEMAASDDPDPVVAGSGAGNLVHVLSATNNGPSDASGVTVTVAPVLPAGVGVDSIVPDIGTIDPATLVWTIGDHPAGITANLTITLTVPLTVDEGIDTISATGTVTANEADPNEENNTAVDPTSVRWPMATFRVTKAYEGDAGPEVSVSLGCTDTSGLLVYDPQTGTTQTSLVVRRFDIDPAGSGTDCTVTEVVPPGYYEVSRDGCDVNPTLDEADVAVNDCTITNAETVARVQVTKTFSDDSTNEIDVTLSCNTGLPLTQTKTIMGGDPTGVIFVVTDYIEGTMDCEVTESGAPDGYELVMNDGDGCAWTAMTSGELYECMIVNNALPASFTVYKEWVIPNTGGDVIDEDVTVTITCDSEIFTSGALNPDEGVWTLSGDLGDGDHLTASVDTTEGPAVCGATESVLQSGVESSDDCAARSIPAGGSDSCTFTNTVFFEAIPTLSQYGLAILALLMLGVGVVSVRRFV